MKIMFVLWIIGANYAEPIAFYPLVLQCITTGVELKRTLETAPRVGLFDVVCVPTVEVQDDSPQEKAPEMGDNNVSGHTLTRTPRQTSPVL